MRPRPSNSPALHRSWHDLGHRRLPDLAALLLCAGLAGCSAPLLNPKGPVGDAEKTILLNSLAVMLVIVVPTILATLAFAWWFRASNHRARYRPQWAYSGRIELITWSVPILITLFLGGIAWVGSHQLDPAEPLPSAKRAITVDVISLDWKWLFIYPDQGVASVNRLIVPAGTPVHLKLTSASVMNAFFVPELGSMIYTMNGMADQLWLQADQPGLFPGRSAHFSGDGFSDMHFDVNAVPDAAFAAWTTEARASGPALDGDSYALLARPSANIAPFTYRAVDATLFERVVAQRLPPAPGPAASTPPSRASSNTKG